MELNKQLVVITGASSGIGAAIARTMAQKGAQIALLARTQSTLEQVATEIIADGGTAYVYPVDLTNASSVEQVAHQILQERGTPHIIVNNAGLGRFLATEETDAEEAVQMMAAPYFAAFFTTRAFLPAMLQRNTGLIINLTSPAAFVPWPGATAYATTRWAMRGFNESLRADLSRTGIRVMLAMPGKVDSSYFTNNPGSSERIPWVSKLMPTLSPEYVAEALVRAVGKNQRTVILPRMLRFLLIMHTIFPQLIEWLMYRTGWQRQATKATL